MSAFEDFIQRELPLRPFTTTDPAQETIPVRRGLGPRQLAFVDLQEGEVLGKEGGVIKGINVSFGSGTCRGYEHLHPTADSVWTINHNIGSSKVQCTIWDDSNHILYPEDVQIINDNTVRIAFGSAQAGRAMLILF